ncbi:hypothetical protein ZWY2020_048682 [Hordeum vulgare]|nr:hypothetical protein ZWY2020_048682 [Hordeum vulgare]
MLLKRKREAHWTADISSDSTSSPLSLHDDHFAHHSHARTGSASSPTSATCVASRADGRARRRTREPPTSSKAEAAANSSPAPAPRIEPRGSAKRHAGAVAAACRRAGVGIRLAN